MKHPTIRIAKRDFPIAFTLDTLSTLEEMSPEFDISKVAEYARSPRGLGNLVFAMAEQGAVLEGHSLDVDRAWFGARISPSPLKIATLQSAILTAIAEALTMETDEEDAGEKDMVLEELKKKEPQGR